jgi:GTP-binding protein
MSAAHGSAFVDQARIEVSAGRGGDGASHFRREKYAPRGGPDGGNGGRGGDIVLWVDADLRTLVDFRFHPKFAAEDGAVGSRNDRTGADGADVRIAVPPGTLVYDDETDRLLADLSNAEQTLVACAGGRGGHGNAHYVSPINQAPIMREMGEPGQQRVLRLELKLLADAALVGYPNAGKSTLIARLSAARPKIANYPFTTLSPNLGVVRLDDGASYVLADLPGLIEGAAEGRGLGHEFLRHLERARVIVHLLDVSGYERQDPVADYLSIRSELAAYDPRLAGLPELVVATKLDLPDSSDMADLVAEELAPHGVERLWRISAVTGAGTAELAQAIAKYVLASATETVVAQEAQAEAELAAAAEPADPTAFEIVEEEEGLFIVRGADVERAVAMCDLHNAESLMHLHRTMTRMGVIDALRRAGCLDGDLVRIGASELDFQE